MAVEIDTATDHVDLWDRLIAFLQLGTTSSGPDWDLIRYEHSEMNAVFRAPGLSGLEDIYVGTGLRVHPDIDTFSIGFWMNRAWNDALDTFSQPGYSGTVWMPVFDNVMPYWFIANGQRLMVAAKVSTVYTSGYAGKFLPYGLPSEYPQPYYLGATAAASTQRWSDTSESVRNFFDPGPHCLLGGPSAVWRSIGNFQQISGENAIDNSNYIHPFSGNISGNSVM